MSLLDHWSLIYGGKEGVAFEALRALLELAKKVEGRRTDVPEVGLVVLRFGGRSVSSQGDVGEISGRLVIRRLEVEEDGDGRVRCRMTNLDKVSIFIYHNLQS